MIKNAIVSILWIFIFSGCSKVSFDSNISSNKKKPASEVTAGSVETQEEKCATRKEVPPPNEEMAAKIKRLFSTEAKADESDVTCPEGHYMFGVKSDGTLICEPLPTPPITTFECPEGFKTLTAKEKTWGCIQDDLNSAEKWQDAANICFTEYGGRLPTGQEWILAFGNSPGKGMGENQEWFADLHYIGVSLNALYWFAPYNATYGAKSINPNNGYLSVDTTQGGGQQSHPYRCFIPSTK